ncbi:hypothetical protein NDU88_006989 [Pleurodeles waltl]|uniref:Uncharacterized protein n=1 Tax=Pleurodeles waltl TaxID=8319 RepID=A0AAV7PQ33_PLEWA|nr:hypothetical protein NDU88_006989 [Pleurodeles waltl]
MAYYAEEDEYEHDLPEIAEEQHTEERLVEALDYHVQDSVNQALIKALKPFTKSLTRFGQHELQGRSLPDTGSQPGQNSNMGFPRQASKGPSSSAEILAHMAASVLQDHEYGSLQTQEIPETFLELSMLTEGNPSSHSLSSDSDHIEPKPSGKRKRKSLNTQESDQTLRNLSFDPENIIHLRSTEWIPCAEVALYVQDRIRKGFDRDVRNALRSECPRPSLQDGGGA